MSAVWLRRIALLLLLTLAASPRALAETLSTLTLDGLSVISFQDDEVLSFPSGSTIVFRFQEPASDGSVPFTIQPADVSIPPIALASDRELRYALAGPATGLMRSASDGRVIEFNAAVSATLVHQGQEGTYTYAMPFTTETVSATNLLGSTSVEVTGLRLVDGYWYAQIVGATVNKANAFPEPGAAVYTILSGSFDQLPE